MSAIEQHLDRLARIRGARFTVGRQPATWTVSLVYDRHVVATGAGRTLDEAGADLERAVDDLTLRTLERVPSADLSATDHARDLRDREVLP